MAHPVPIPPAPLRAPVLRCLGCGMPCGPVDALHTSDAVFAVCPACWVRDTAPDPTPRLRAETSQEACTP